MKPEVATRLVSSLALLLFVSAAGCGSSDDTEVDGSPYTPTAVEGKVGLPLYSDELAGTRIEVVFESIRVLGPAGTVLTSKEEGKLTLHAWQRAARPWTYKNEPYTYHKQAWQKPAQGGVEHGYRVYRTPNDVQSPVEEPAGPPMLGPGIAERAAGQAPVEVVLRLRNYPDWDIPLYPSSEFLTADEVAQGIAERQIAFADRQERFQSVAAGAMEQVRSLGGTVQGGSWGSGLILAKVSPGALLELAKRTDLASIDDSGSGGATDQDGQDGSAVVEDAYAPTTGIWALGEARRINRTGADRFHAAGMNGQFPNRGHSQLTVGIVEALGIMDDEACLLGDGNACNPAARTVAKYKCDNVGASPCVATANLPDAEEPPNGPCLSTAECTGTWANSVCHAGQCKFQCAFGDTTTCQAIDSNWACQGATPTAPGQCGCVGTNCSRHATAMASIILGDYRGGQADTLPVGDNSRVGCTGAGCVHDPAFKNKATGIAPEAGFVFFGGHANGAAGVDGAAALTDSLTKSATENVDVLNNSWVWDENGCSCDGSPCGPCVVGGCNTVSPSCRSVLIGSDCNPLAIRSFEAAAEDAFDDGILVLAAAGNNSVGKSTFDGVCDMLSPADLPKVMAVNAFNTGCAGTSEVCANNKPCCFGTCTAGVCSAGGPPLGCDANYNSCTPVRGSSSQGGMTANTNDGAHPGAISGIGLVAPAGLRYVTDPRGDYGQVNDGGEFANFGGSSSAVAMTSGMAILVKNAFLKGGWGAWINDPGWLMTAMLGMGDRHDGWNTQRTTGFSNVWGAGKLNLRRFDENINDVGTPNLADDQYGVVGLTFTAGQQGQAIVVGGSVSTLLPGTTLVKTVMLQIEDMSNGKTQVNNINIKTEIRDPNPVEGCVPTTLANLGTLRFSREDTSFDIKSMVAITSADTTLAGKCVFNVVTASQLIPGLGAQVNIFGYLSTMNDDTSLPDADSDMLADYDELKAGSCVSSSQTGCTGNCTGVSTLPKTKDSDCDNITDHDEMTGLTSPTKFDTDNDGSNDGVDFVQMSTWKDTPTACTTRVIYPGLVGLGINSTTTSTARRPTAKWNPAGGVTLGQIDYCSDAACTTVLQSSGDTTASSWTPSSDLPTTLNYARAFMQAGEDVGCQPSALGRFWVGSRGVSSGASHACAINATGGLKCWGFNVYGQLGDSTTIDRNTPIQPGTLSSGVKSVTSGGAHTCALMTAGTVKCWGDNSYGAVGYGSTKFKYALPGDVPGLTNVVSLNAGSNGIGTCAVTATGGVKCWGANDYGEIGNGTTQKSGGVVTPTDVKINSTTLLSGATSVERGANGVCAITSQTVPNGVKCWGNNSYGQIGDNTNVSRSYATDVLTAPGVLLQGVASLGIGGYHSCALMISGGIKCWGNNSSAQLGDMTHVNHWMAADVEEATGVPVAGYAAVTAGYLHTCGTTIGGNTYCWGDDDFGQLGFGQINTLDYGAPVGPVGVSGTQVSAGSRFTCSYNLDGLVTCWGRNDKGQHGTGDTHMRTAPDKSVFGGI